ncbi:bath-38 [Symbiodinium sp. CCMP2592]|nr:bath-38 [Symbiodinium sp. CCMP2592]
MATMERGTKRTAEHMESQAADNIKTPTAASLEQVGDVRLQFGDDTESSMLASSHLLRVASPVFNRMFTSGMKEQQQSVIKVDVASKEEFATFYNLLGPWAWSTHKVTEANVDSLLTISDYYQVEIIKQTCEDLLLSLAPTCARLLQADRHGLKRQYQRCVGHVAEESTEEDLEVLRQSSADILLQVAVKQQDFIKALLTNRNEVIRYVRAHTSRETFLGVVETMVQMQLPTD